MYLIKLFRFLKPFVPQILVVLVLLFVQAILDLYLPNIMSDIIDIGVVNEDMDYILRSGGYMLIVALVGAAANIGAALISSKVATGFARDIRKGIFTRVTNFSSAEIDKFNVSSLVTRSTNDITQIQTMSVFLFRIVVSAPIMMIGGIIMALSKDKELSLIFLVNMPILAALIGFVAYKGIPLFKENQKRLDKLTSVLREKLIGIRVIRAFNKEETEKVKFNDANVALTENAVKVNRIMAIMMPAMMFLMNATVLAIVWFGGIRIDSGAMEVGDMMAFMQYAMQILFSLIMFAMMFVLLPRAQASAVRINEVLDVQPTIHDPQVPATSEISGGNVKFDNVSFSYEGASTPAIENVSFEAKKGQFTAIIGGTGSGKSTILNLLARFYDVTGGKVTIDGIDIRDMNQKDLRANLGYVTQSAVLFSGTVKDNVTFGDKDPAEMNIDEALEISQSMEFVSKMENREMEEISQGGTNVSGGQKQRLSIARAIARNPRIYMFDDSFSALDYKTDRLLRSQLKEKFSDATVIVVAQRIASIMDADQILVLDDGAIVGRGTHKSLLEDCEVYKEIVYSQLSKEEIA